MIALSIYMKNYTVIIMVEVVNIRTCKPPWGQEGDVKIDRTTKWGNPFHMQNDSDFERNRVCNAYELYFPQSGLNIVELLHAKRLGCWCKPKRCHGDYLKKRIEEILNRQTKL